MQYHDNIIQLIIYILLHFMFIWFLYDYFINHNFKLYKV
jgi:hypothetical protein